MDSQNSDTEPKVYPLLPLRDVVVYPHMAVPLFVGREKSILALEKGMSTDKQVVLVTQKDPAEDSPALDDVHQIGTLATILQLLKLPDGTLKVLVEGSSRVKLVNPVEGEHFLETQFETLGVEDQDEKEVGALSRATKMLFDQYVNLNKKIPSDVITTVNAIEDKDRLADTIASHMTLSLTQKQEVLEIADLAKRFDHLMGLMETEIDLAEVEQRIRGRVKKQMEKSQREYYLNEQIKAIQKELGDEDGVSEIEQLEGKIDEAGMPKSCIRKG